MHFNTLSINKLLAWRISAVNVVGAVIIAARCRMAYWAVSSIVKVNNIISL
jgi:hypothetical protein